ncbi:hypothetical protein [Aliikangiella coralliicola]|uniref:Uncharacterized protein n=1 Tax=Aliikangiella coralliicola TaxID=2592383 RepID=A0A545UIU5_9GAMM|nr:hypothetical protein [Aliikangiella coralliicola]TQV89386.1 hypothetical protein FLL46_00445 [Aliikangiella coralliicola]
MKKWFVLAALGVVVLIIQVDAKEPLSDKEVTNILIKQSIRNYSGNCPCPYNRDRAGRRCGKRSAWSKPGGASPLCFASDVTKEMIGEFRRGTKSSK